MAEDEANSDEQGEGGASPESKGALGISPDFQVWVGHNFKLEVQLLPCLQTTFWVLKNCRRESHWQFLANVQSLAGKCQVIIPAFEALIGFSNTNQYVEVKIRFWCRTLKKSITTFDPIETVMN